MITDADIKKLAKKFTTKSELKNELKKFATKEDLKKLDLDVIRLRIEMNERFEKIEDTMATKDDFRNFMVVLDKVLKEVLAMRDEQNIHVGDHMRINDRFEAIEQTPTVAHELRLKSGH